MAAEILSTVIDPVSAKKIPRRRAPQLDAFAHAGCLWRTFIVGIPPDPYYPGMQSDPLAFGGEFQSPVHETNHQADRLSESVRHVRHVFQCAFFINLLFYLNDWELYGQPHFYLGMVARTVIVCASLAGAVVARNVQSF
ncbi:MAG TPA: hypothetical protein VN809_10475, partial [Telmatospirillum sp.]|nr:hypothetical protein [Telmatospirillum sp.]